MKRNLVILAVLLGTIGSGYAQNYADINQLTEAGKHVFNIYKEFKRLAHVDMSQLPGGGLDPQFYMDIGIDIYFGGRLATAGAGVDDVQFKELKLLFMYELQELPEILTDCRLYFLVKAFSIQSAGRLIPGGGGLFGNGFLSNGVMYDLQTDLLLGVDFTLWNILNITLGGYLNYFQVNDLTVNAVPAYEYIPVENTWTINPIVGINFYNLPLISLESAFHYSSKENRIDLDELLIQFQLSQYVPYLGQIETGIRFYPFFGDEIGVILNWNNILNALNVGTEFYARRLIVSRVFVEYDIKLFDMGYGEEMLNEGLRDESRTNATRYTPAKAGGFLLLGAEIMRTPETMAINGSDYFIFGFKAGFGMMFAEYFRYELSFSFNRYPELFRYQYGINCLMLRTGISVVM